MGSVGLGITNAPTSDTDKYTNFNSYQGSMKWFANPKLSNLEEWNQKLLTSAEKSAIVSYTGSAYSGINNTLYNKAWESMLPHEKEKASAIYNGLSKFELKHGITVTRQCDFQIFGGAKYEKMTVDQVKSMLSGSNGVLQHDGFMSFGANDKGVSIAGSGVIVKLRIPPSKGAGAYVNPISLHKGQSENEFLLNNNAVLKYDVNSVKMVGGKVYVEADWLGQAKSQTISATNKSVLSKTKKKKK